MLMSQTDEADTSPDDARTRRHESRHECANRPNLRTHRLRRQRTTSQPLSELRSKWPSGSLIITTASATKRPEPRRPYEQRGGRLGRLSVALLPRRAAIQLVTRGPRAVDTGRPLKLLGRRDHLTQSIHQIHADGSPDRRVELLLRILYRGRLSIRHWAMLAASSRSG